MKHLHRSDRTKFVTEEPVRTPSERAHGGDRRGFNRGVAYAIAILSGTHLQPGLAAQIIRESGITLGEFEASEADETDMREVRIVFLTELSVRCARTGEFKVPP